MAELDEAGVDFLFDNQNKKDYEIEKINLDVKSQNRLVFPDAKPDMFRRKKQTKMGYKERPQTMGRDDKESRDAPNRIHRSNPVDTIRTRIVLAEDLRLATQIACKTLKTSFVLLIQNTLKSSARIKPYLNRGPLPDDKETVRRRSPNLDDAKPTIIALDSSVRHALDWAVFHERLSMNMIMVEILEESEVLQPFIGALSFRSYIEAAFEMASAAVGQPADQLLQKAAEESPTFAHLLEFEG